MKKKVLKIGKDLEVNLPEDFLLSLDLTPGSTVEASLDEKKGCMILKPVRGGEFLEHFKDSIESMA